MAALGRKASEAAGSFSAAALSNPFTRRVAEVIGTVTNKDGGSGGRHRGRKGNGADDREENERCSEPGTPFGFLDNMCGPMLRNFKGAESNDADELAESVRAPSSRRRGGNDAPGAGGGEEDVDDGGEGRRPTGSYDYDDETNVTDMTGSYEDDDETYDDDGSRRKSRSEKRSRGRDRKPRSPADSPSEMTGGYSEFDDDTTQNDTVTDASSAYHNDKRSSGGKHKDEKSKKKEDDDTATKDSEKLITQPLASGFAKRGYFTKAGIGRSTQHYEGLTLTGNTVLMLAAAMKLKGCPTICDEDLRRVEQTYPNQFSRLPDELLLSSGWRRISKYCHFSHKPLPDGVPFFHSRKRCHPNGGFYFLLCSAVGMTRLMDVEPLNRDALAVLQTDFPMTCEKAPPSLCEDPEDWTLVNKFCFFSGGPINVEEDVYYRAELGGTEIYMLAFLSPSLSPEELYRLKPSGSSSGGSRGQQQEDTGPLKSVAAVEEVESVYDLTERDFDDLKLYHLGPCRALPPYLLHPETWTKVLPPRFVGAREEALRIAQDWLSRHPPSVSHSVAGESRYPSAAGNTISAAMQGDATGSILGGESPGSGYVELGGGGGRPPPSARSSMPSVGPGGAGYPPQYQGHGGMHTPMSQMSQQDSHAPYYPPQSTGGGMDQSVYSSLHHQQQQPPQSTGGGMDQSVYSSQYHQQHQPPQYNALGVPPSPMETELNYYYGASPGTSTGMPPPPGSVGAPPQSPSGSHFQQHSMPPPSTTSLYGNPNVGGPSPERMSASPMNPMGGGGPYDSGHHSVGVPSPERMSAASPMNPMRGGGPYNAGPHQLYGNIPQHMMVDPHWRDVQEEGAFGRLGRDQPHDEAIATRGGIYGDINGSMNGVGPGGDGSMHHQMGPAMDVRPMERGPMEPEDQMYHSSARDPPDADTKSQYTYGQDGKSQCTYGDDTMASGTSSLMGGAQNRLKQNRMKKMKEKRSQRPDLSTKIGVDKKSTTPGAGDDSTWDTRTDGESSYGTSLVSGSSYTDTTNPNERNSRRALILQMAKARMKNVKILSTEDKNAGQGQVCAPAQDEMVDDVAGLELD